MTRGMLVLCPARGARTRALCLVTFVTLTVSSGVSGRRAFGAAADDRQLVLAGTGALKIVVRGAGWVRVGQPALVAAGLDPSVDPGRLQLYADGVEQAIVVSGDGNAAGLDFSLGFLGEVARRVRCDELAFVPDRSAVEFARAS
jgi:hypothetical protein